MLEVWPQGWLVALSGQARVSLPFQYLESGFSQGRLAGYSLQELMLSVVSVGPGGLAERPGVPLRAAVGQDGPGWEGSWPAGAWASPEARSC